MANSETRNHPLLIFPQRLLDAEGDRKNSVKVKEPAQAMAAELKRSHSRSELRAFV
ncbi:MULTISPECIES: hypothetical protein [unclassified Duganella]|uniref:hypothetical protein n=1 Tax=unclassified Duganella TaxID=2636909 RepID=UPI001314803F|nr:MULTISPECIES: hypothetical protein [unclassified Duganella]